MINSWMCLVGHGVNSRLALVGVFRLYHYSPIVAGGHDRVPGPGQAGRPWRAMIGQKFYVHTIFHDAQFLGASFGTSCAGDWPGRAPGNRERDGFVLLSRLSGLRAARGWRHGQRLTRACSSVDSSAYGTPAASPTTNPQPKTGPWLPRHNHMALLALFCISLEVRVPNGKKPSPTHCLGGCGNA
jgi:hypothetical protein